MSDKREAEVRFLTPGQVVARMRQGAETIEILNKALMFMATEFAIRAPEQAGEAALYFERQMRSSAMESTRHAEMECFSQLDCALSLYGPETERVTEDAA